MKHKHISKLVIVAASLLFSCTIVERDNPYDSKSINYKKDHLSSSSVRSSSSVVSFVCSNADSSYSCDMSGYRTVEINGQVWMAQNLNCDVEGSYCYGNKTENCDIYGRLYDWCTAKAVCHNGWHLPSNTEWKELVDFAGGMFVAGLYLKADSGWNDNEYGKSGNGEDKYGFSALPGGGRYQYGSPYGYFTDFLSIGECGIWWSATEHSANYTSAKFIEMCNHNPEYAMESSREKDGMYSVRCVRD